MEEETKKQLAELREFHELCKPLIEYMRKKLTPNDAILITNSQAQIFKCDMCVPADFRWGAMENFLQ